MIFERYPDLGKNRVVWVKDSVIVRTDHIRLAEMEQTLSMRIGETRLSPGESPAQSASSKDW